MRVLAVYNIKGGVGKTATCVNLAYLSALEGNKTLLIDLDEQGASSYYYRVEQGLNGKARKILYGDKSIESAIKSTAYENLDIIPADQNYRKAEQELHDRKNPVKWLSSLLKPLEKQYDCIVLDCPPSISLISENVFHYADYVLVPVVPTVLSVLTYNQLVAFFKEKEFKKDKLFPFFSMVEKRKSLHANIIADFAEQFKNVVNIQIPYSAEVEKMGIYRTPIVHKYPNAQASKAFQELWEAIS